MTVHLLADANANKARLAESLQQGLAQRKAAPVQLTMGRKSTKQEREQSELFTFGGEFFKLIVLLQ